MVELIALDNAQIEYSTVQNWYPGDKEGRRYLQLRHQARQVPGRQFEDLLDAGRNRLGDRVEVSELHSAGRQLGGRVLLRRADQQSPAADAGTKMIHIGKNTRSTIVSKGISAATDRTLSRPGQDPKVRPARATTRMRFAAYRRQVRRAHFPVHGSEEHVGADGARGSTSKIGEDQLFYLRQRGLKAEGAVSMVVNGFCPKTPKPQNPKTPDKYSNDCNVQ